MSMSGGRIRGMIGVTKNLTEPLLSVVNTRSKSYCSLRGGPRLDGSSNTARHKGGAIASSELLLG